ncbi:SGNH/GDSL hydrolase family protein [Rubrivirga sp. IMCC45206]|uniref:SGNH/GDSL hydrolase family protein n=1 Tax=Rubrivirga sp. IMCC45206 TaxID=3391614 RepID=UPI0039900595
MPSPPSSDPARPPAPADALRFLALGDSYTIGEGVAPEGRWPVQLAAALRASGTPVADPEVVAVTGWTVEELDAGIDAADLEGPFDLVTLLIGVNDQYRGRDLDGYRAQYRAMLARAVAFAGGDPARVVAVSFPDWGVTPFASDRDAAQIAREVDAFNAAARAIAQTEGVAWVDITPLSREQGALVAGDGLHPNAAAYTGWTERIRPAAKAALTD